MCTYSAAYLINEILAVVVTQLLCANNTMEVGFHELLNEVHLPELIETWGLKDVKDRNDVLVTEMTEEFYLAQGAEAEHGVIERCYALDSDFAL